MQKEQSLKHMKITEMLDTLRKPAQKGAGFLHTYGEKFYYWRVCFNNPPLTMKDDFHH